MDNTDLKTCWDCKIPQPRSQFQDLENFKFPGRNGAMTSHGCCVGCQSAFPEATSETRKRACTVASFAPLADGKTSTCTKCGHTKPVAHFVSYRRGATSTTSQCSECRDTSLRAKGKVPPPPPPGTQPDFVWITIGSPPGDFFLPVNLTGCEACTGQQ